ncbi:MAG: hypothetical protein A2075_23300 [Geobacteraceae bacterium GWC2_58_44]|nr:MAG: hypothetical protein A2075_23300 [Geobacteraceae bacterium GWC2_58_44]
MAVFAGKTFSDTELLNGARKGLYERSRLLSPDATLSAIQDLKFWVAEELSFEEGASASFGRILSELWHSEYLDQLPPLLNRFERLVCAYFVRRGSVTAFHGFCNAWREGVLRRILLFAEEGLELNDPGHPPVPYALLVAGSLGRREQTLEDGSRYFLVWPEGDEGYFEQFAYRIMAILEQCSLVGDIRPNTVGRILWRGSLADWEELAAAQGEGEELSAHLELLSDLRHVYGDETIGSKATQMARSCLEGYRNDPHITTLAGRQIAAPVALGILGRIRVERTGEHVGSFNLAQSGLTPLVNAVRLLAMQHDLNPGPTLERLTALSTLRILEEPYVKRIEAAYHLLAGLKIGKEIALEQPYICPAGLTPVERQKLKAALETVRHLQRLVRRAVVNR